MSAAISVEQLSNDQRDAYDDIMRWIDSGRSGVLTLGGYAGSGKSTLIALIASRVGLPAFCAYTGKATSVLRRKLRDAGLNTAGTQPRKDGVASRDRRPYCGTIHSLIYKPCECREPSEINVEKPCPERGCSRETRWEDGKSVCTEGHVGLVETAAKFEGLERRVRLEYPKRGPDGVCTLCRGKEWLRRDMLDRDYGLIIVDEASMVDDMMLRDLREYEVPILAVGDHGQLPPVGGSGNLMRAPQIRLERIHRQAEGNPIIALSKIIRETGRLPDVSPGDAVCFERLRFTDRIIEDRYADASPERLLEMGIVCYTNRRRVGLNDTVRRVRQITRSGRYVLPRAGEHVVCLRNMKEVGRRPLIANGMRGVLMTDADPKQLKNNAGRVISTSETQLVGSIAFPEDEIEAFEYEMFQPQFGREKTFSSPDELLEQTGVSSFAKAGALFDYGYAMTCHKMQGSAVEDLLLCVERPGPVDDESWRKWLYTAVTRSAQKLTVLR